MKTQHPSYGKYLGLAHQSHHQSHELILDSAFQRCAAGEPQDEVYFDLVEGYCYGHGSANAFAIQAACERGAKLAVKPLFQVERDEYGNWLVHSGDLSEVARGLRTAGCVPVGAQLRQWTTPAGQITFVGCNQPKCRWEAIYVFAPAPVISIPTPAVKTFRVAAVSSNSNSFGLHGHILIAEDGEAWEVARSRGPGNLPCWPWEKGDDVIVHMKPAPHWAGLGCEIPRRLPDAPTKVVAELFN